MNKSNSKTGRVLLPVFLICGFVASAQKGNVEMYKSVYKVTTPGLSLKVADTVFKQMDLSPRDMSISLGTIYYTNYWKNGFSKTEVTFVKNPGVQQIADAKPVTFYAKPADSVMIHYEGQRLVSKTRFSLPPLTASTETKVVNGYKAQLYTYTSPENMKVRIWASKQLSPYVTPGIYYCDMGGIVSMQYVYEDQQWSIDLLHQSTNKEAMDFKVKELNSVKGPPIVHYLMSKD